METNFNSDLFKERVLRLKGKETDRSFEKRSGVLARTMQDIRKKADYFPSFTNLLRFADYFNVSIDYLTGRSDEFHNNNRDISDLTGLSENAIEKLRLLNKGANAKGDTTMNPNKTILAAINILIEAIEFYDNGEAKKDGNIFEHIYNFLYINRKKLYNAHEKLKSGEKPQEVFALTNTPPISSGLPQPAAPIVLDVHKLAAQSAINEIQKVLEGIKEKMKNEMWDKIRQERWGDYPIE